MAMDLVKFIAGAFTKTIQVFTSAFSTELAFDWNTWNVSEGINRGKGPRVGMALLPFQAGAEAVGGFPGLQQAEDPFWPDGFKFRTKILGIVPIVLGGSTTIRNRQTFYAAIVTDNAYLSVILLGTDAGGGFVQYQPTLAAGLSRSANDVFQIATFQLINELVPMQSNGTKGTNTQAMLAFDQSLWSASFDVFTVPGIDYPMQWMAGTADTVGSATRAPSIKMWRDSALRGPGGVIAKTHALGIPSTYNLANFAKTTRNVAVFALTNQGVENNDYKLSYDPTTSIIKSVPSFDISLRTLDYTAVPATNPKSYGAYANDAFAVVNDPLTITNTGYKAVAIAAKKSYLCILQEWDRNIDGSAAEYIDLVHAPMAPGTNTSDYFENPGDNLTSTPNCFSHWSDFVPGTAMLPAFAGGPQLGPVDTGVLRKNTVYEFTYSIYNKRLGFETNVGAPVKFQTGVNDFVSLVLFDYSAATNRTLYANQMLGHGQFMPYPSSNFNFASTYQSPGFYMNYLEYRFYVRQLGANDWLACGQIDAPKLWFYPYNKFSVCTFNAVPLGTGGTPGGYNDYSPLPDDQYTCVVQYKNRAFWLSDKQMIFSLPNNLFAYPGRNSFSSSGGDYRGAIVHNYPGQAEQDSRLVVFTTKGTFVGRFSGERTPQYVSPSIDGSVPPQALPLDGSDFALDPWTSVTAFSFRSAVVAEGILYWWGPQGIYRDDGVSTPTKISIELEPTILTEYDASAKDQITAAYNPNTKEIVWVYTPNPLLNSPYPSQSIIFNTITGDFDRGIYNGKIDWIAPLQTDGSDGWNGHRTLIGSRESAAGTVQRAYFHDQYCRSGDIFPKRDFAVKEISTPSVGSKRLTLAAGFDAAKLATVAVGDLVALQGIRYYITGTSDTDMLAKVSAIDTGTGPIDFVLPAGAVLADAVLTQDQYFQVYLGPTNGFSYQWQTNYWTAGGLNKFFYFLWIYFTAKIRKWASDFDYGPTIEYRTPTAQYGFIGDDLAIQDNSDGNWQVYHPLRTGNDNHEGQALKIQLRGTHIAHEWVVQYLEVHANPFDADGLRQFEE